MARIALGVLVVAVYTFSIAFEIWRERRKSLYSRTAAIVVPCLHAAIFLMPLAMRAFLPEMHRRALADGVRAGDHDLCGRHRLHRAADGQGPSRGIYRSAASTDYLTGLLNRRAFLENALTLCARAARRREPVTLLMFDLDQFKSINDRFGHAVGDEVLRVFAQVVRKSMRASDIIGRLGGEEFAAIVPEPIGNRRPHRRTHARPSSRRPAS